MSRSVVLAEDHSPVPVRALRSQPVRLAVLLLTVAAGLLVVDAVLNVVWWTTTPVWPSGVDDHSEATGYLLGQARGQAAWSAAANTIAAVAAALAAVWLARDHRLARSTTLTLISVTLGYRLTVMWNLLAQLNDEGPWPAWVPGLRLVMAVVVFPCLLGAGAFLLHKSLTRAERHRALIGADTSPHPKLATIGAYLLVMYGMAWIVVAVLGYLSFRMWVEAGGPGMDGFDARLDFAETLVFGTVGLIGGLVVFTAGMALWFRRPRRLLWRIALGTAIGQLTLSLPVFLWEAVPSIDELHGLPAGNVASMAVLLDVLSAAQLAALIAAIAVLWHPRVAGFYRSQRLRPFVGSPPPYPSGDNGVARIT
jgi:hypothetical protein